MYCSINLERVNSPPLSGGINDHGRSIVQSLRVYQWSIGTPAHRESSCWRAYPYIQANRQVEIRDGSRWGKFDDLYTGDEQCVLRAQRAYGEMAKCLATLHIDSKSIRRISMRCVNTKGPRAIPWPSLYNCFLYRSQLNAAKTDRFLHRSLHSLPLKTLARSEDCPAATWPSRVRESNISECRRGITRLDVVRVSGACLGLYFGGYTLINLLNGWFHRLLRNYSVEWRIKRIMLIISNNLKRISYWNCWMFDVCMTKLTILFFFLFLLKYVKNEYKFVVFLLKLSLSSSTELLCNNLGGNLLEYQNE